MEIPNAVRSHSQIIKMLFFFLYFNFFLVRSKSCLQKVQKSLYAYSQVPCLPMQVGNLSNVKVIFTSKCTIVERYLFDPLHVLSSISLGDLSALKYCRIAPIRAIYNDENCFDLQHLRTSIESLFVALRTHWHRSKCNYFSLHKQNPRFHEESITIIDGRPYNQNVIHRKSCLPRL